MTDATISKLAFERRYSDDSGIEFAVRYDNSRENPVELEHIDSVSFGVDQIDWLIDCLHSVRRAAQGRTP